MCDCPSKSSLVKRPTPKLGEAPSPSRLDRKLLQWCLRAHDPRGPAALRDEVAEAVEQPRGGGSGGGHGVTARPLLSAPRGLSRQSAPLFPLKAQRSHFVRAQHRKAMLYDVTYTTDLLLTQCQRQLGQQDL